jgi:protein-S-isoprenylcysteine O-methyltransferase Ste14
MGLQLMPVAPTALDWGGHVARFLAADDPVRGVAGATGYWQAEVFALVYLVFSLPITFHLLRHPALLLRRFRAGPLAESEPSQRVIVSLILLCALAMGVVLALDHEHGWSDVPAPVVLLGDLLVAAGLVLVWLVFRANPFAAAAVTVETGQAVTSAGPYALVRHPLYSAGLLLFLGIPIALGSWWGLVLVPPILALVIWRLLDEEAYLSAHLPGYRDYRATVTHRLIPAIW